MAQIFGALFGTYFLVYPAIYFVYNWFISEIGYIQYQIPGFWVGMAGFLLFNLVKNSIFKGK
jgi:ABC-type dipeptide/oligopeptide/nickel transport system permease component